MSGGIENNILGYIDSNDSNDYGEDTGVDNANIDNGADPFDDGAEDTSLQEQVKQRKDEDENLEDPLLKKQSQPDKANQRQQEKKTDKRPRTNERGDLVDEQGNVIARHGRERRIETENVRLRETTRNLQERNETLVRQLADVQFLDGLPRQLGLDNNSVAEALQIAAIFTKNPIQAVRQLTEKALAQGLDLRDIFDDETLPNIGTKATKQLLDERLKPFEQERKSAEEVEQLRRQGQETANQFLLDYPDAEHHQSDIANLMGEIIKDYAERGRQIDPYLAAEKAWEMVQDFANEHKLDLSQPLRPQVEARARQNQSNRSNGEQGKPTPRNTQPGGGQRRTRPMPNGMRTTGSESTVQHRSQMASPDDSMQSIVREAMRENGINI